MKHDYEGAFIVALKWIREMKGRRVERVPCEECAATLGLETSVRLQVTHVQASLRAQGDPRPLFYLCSDCATAAASVVSSVALVEKD
jgi:hypothetical protein